MHAVTIRYRVGDGPEQTEQLTSDVAALSKAIEWAPEQLALRLMRDQVIKSGAELTTVSVHPTVEIPTEVRDNSETVTDYAFSRHRSPDKGVCTPDYRDRSIDTAVRYLNGYTHYTWHDVNQGNRQGWGAGQRCRFDMITNPAGDVTSLFHTEYFTRVTCERCKPYRAQSYASHYVVLADQDGCASESSPTCDAHLHQVRKDISGLDLTVYLSESLYIGQHD